MCQLLGRNANAPTDVMFSFAGLATEPLTADEAWTAMAPGELKVFVDGAPLDAAGCR